MGAGVRRICVGMADGLAVLDRAGEGAGRWALSTRLDGLQTQCVAVDPRRPERVYCGTSGALGFRGPARPPAGAQDGAPQGGDDRPRGLWRSADGGETWTPVGPGIAHDAVMTVAVSPVEPGAGGGVVHAGTEPSDLFRSADGGTTWDALPALRALPAAPTWAFPPRPWTHHVRWIEPDPAVPGRVFVSIEQGGVLRTADGGRTFTDRRPGGPPDAHTLATHPGAPGRVYAPGPWPGLGVGLPAAAAALTRGRAAGAVARLVTRLGLTGKAYAESPDAGATWRHASVGLAHPYLWSVAVDPSDPDAVVLSAAASPQQAHDAAVYAAVIYHRRGPGPWRRAQEGLPPERGTGIAVLRADPAEPGAIYAATNRGVFRSPDAGATWRRLETDWPERYARQHVQGLALLP